MRVGRKCNPILRSILFPVHLHALSGRFRKRELFARNLPDSSWLLAMKKIRKKIIECSRFSRHKCTTNRFVCNIHQTLDMLRPACSRQSAKRAVGYCVRLYACIYIHVQNKWPPVIAWVQLTCDQSVSLAAERSCRGVGRGPLN